MEVSFTRDSIALNKELTALDLFVIEFCGILNGMKINYVLVSGYVAILFGRSSEDISIFIQKMDKEKFTQLWKALGHYDCINASGMEGAY